MTLQERVKEFIKYSGITPKQFENYTGLSNGTCAKLNTSIRKKTCDRISNAFPNLNMNWLLTGEGEMLLSTAKKEEKKRPSMTERILPLIPVDAIAGVPSDDIQGMTLQDCEQYAIPEFINSGAQFLIRVSGDSMRPQYNNGDIIAIRKIPEITFFQWGKIYVLDTNQGILIKRVYEDKDNPDNIICHSENTDVFADFSLPKADIRSLSIVLGVIHME